MGCLVRRERAATLIEALTPIWQRVLQRPSIRVEDNFFDLGGDPSILRKLFAEIAQLCGRELPPEMIYHAPTIAALAALLEQPVTPRVPPLVHLKTGKSEPPVFIAHGIGGTVLGFFQLVRHMQIQNPVYGLQAKGIDGVDEPFDRIEDMAQFYLDRIKELQPHGPYLLIGYSLGGLVMMDMARRLLEKGEKVSLLAMLETYPHSRYLPLGQRLRLATRLARRHVSTAMYSPMRERLSSLIRPFKRLSQISGDISRSASSRAPIEESLATAMQRVHNGSSLAWTRYRPRFYGGKIRFVRATISSEYPEDPAAVWANLADEFEVETVPGNHLGILTTHFESVGSVISRYVREALRQE